MKILKITEMPDGSISKLVISEGLSEQGALQLLNEWRIEDGGFPSSLYSYETPDYSMAVES